MDFSGFGMMLVACVFMILIPPIITGILFVPIFIIQKRSKNSSKWFANKPGVIFIVLYLISIVGSCFFIYFFYLRFMYVM
jgi:hypothetical protein